MTKYHPIKTRQILRNAMVNEVILVHENLHALVISFLLFSLMCGRKKYKVNILTTKPARPKFYQRSYLFQTLNQTLQWQWMKTRNQN